MIIGIDPGLSGAVAALSEADCQLIVWRGFKKLLDISLALERAFEDKVISKVVCEAVHAMPGQGVCSMFTFGKSTGVALGAVHSEMSRRWMSSDRLVEVPPQKWQNWYRKQYPALPKGPGTFDSREVIKLVFPEKEVDKCRKKRGALDHNATDAALLAYWGLMNN